jgi:acetyl-CoA acetyltransferase
MKNRELAIVGLGVHPYGKWPDKSMAELGCYAITEALEDAHMKWKDIETMACGAYMWIADQGGVPSLLLGTSISTMMGGTGIPCCNIVNACATGQSILREACLAVASGEHDIAIAVGSDKSAGGFFRPQGNDRRYDNDWIRYAMVGETNPGYWAMEMRRRIHDCGTTEEDMAMVKVITSKGGVHNPNARYRKEYTLQEVLESPMVCDPLRLYEICATSDSASAIIVVPMDQAEKYTDKPILIEGLAVGSPSFGDPCIPLTYLSSYPRADVGTLGWSESRNALAAAYKQAGRTPDDINVIELPDNSSWHYLTYMDMILQLPYGGSDQLLRDGYFNVPDGKVPVCPSGGFGAFGEATVAQGLWQCIEVAYQLRGDLGPRQITNNPKVGLAQSYGYAGNNGVCIMSKAF